MQIDLDELVVRVHSAQEDEDLAEKALSALCRGEDHDETVVAAAQARVRAAGDTVHDALLDYFRENERRRAA